MKKNFFVTAALIIALCGIFVSCKQTSTPAVTDFVGTYDMHLVYDSVTDSEGTWFENEFFQEMTGKRNPPKDGYLTIEEGANGKLIVSVTVANEAEDKVLFTTTATEKEGILVLDNCQSDYYYSTTERYIDFTFHGFENKMPVITFKGIYTINLGADYSYLLSFTCTKRK